MTGAEAQGLAKNPNVLTVKPDRVVSVDLHQNNYQTLTEGPDRVDLEQNATANVTGQPGATQLNINVAVIDTGVVTTHPEINVGGGKGFSGANCSDAGYEDDHGHGTHVSGTIAARDNDRGLVGMAPGARIWGVKVLAANGSGEDSCVIAGIDWVTNRRQEFNDGPGDGDPGIDIAVVNMSLGGDTASTPADDPICQAINNSVVAGVIYAVAAGNSHHDVDGSVADGYDAASPAHCSNAITVSAFGDFDGKSGGLSPMTATFGACPAGNTVVHDDTFACFSNFGPAVDIAAPGVNIVSTYLFGGCGAGVPCYATLSGTSMATPHVAGALALFKVATGYSGTAEASSVMAAFTAAGYTRPQDASCGFTGDPDATHEPVLYVGTGCDPNDWDMDGVPDATDNCPRLANPAQQDADGDAVGDACDNCPADSNVSQANVVHPATPAGDACDDPDADAVFDATDNCPDTANPGQQNAVHPASPAGDACDDPDADAVFDPTDNCPDTANPGQQNAVHPASPAGDACDDPDADAVFDAVDNCPDNANAGQQNAVHPASLAGDACDDPDADAVFDAADNCPDVANPGQQNVVHPSSPAGDACDDPDADAVYDNADNCPNWSNPTQVLPAWPVPAGDSDCDGFPDSVPTGPPDPRASEAFVGTDSARHCANTPARNDEPLPDRWPLDFDDNQVVDGSDLLTFAPLLGRIGPNPPYATRFDINGDGRISGSDLLKFAPFFSKHCA